MMGILRNIPFTIMGLIIILIYYKKEQNTKNLNIYGLMYYYHLYST